MSEGELIEIEQRARRLQVSSMDEDGNVVHADGWEVAEDVERLVAVIREGVRAVS